MEENIAFDLLILKKRNINNDETIITLFENGKYAKSQIMCGLHIIVPTGKTLKFRIKHGKPKFKFIDFKKAKKIDIKQPNKYLFLDNNDYSYTIKLKIDLYDYILPFYTNTGWIPFNFDEILVEDFTQGECQKLAFALQEKIGGDIYGMKTLRKKSRKQVGKGFDHYFIFYKNRLIDIRGIWTKEQFLEFIHSPNPENIDDECYMEEYNTFIENNICIIEKAPEDYEFMRWQKKDYNDDYLKHLGMEGPNYDFALNYARKTAENIINSRTFQNTFNL